jgi:hypothetical protein
VSIYCTLWQMRFPADGSWGMTHPNIPGQDMGDGFMVYDVTDAEEYFVEVFAQAVPQHINYTGEAWEWLPPPVSPNAPYPRAVVICGPYTTKVTPRCGQEYANPLLILTGEEYAGITWRDLWDRIDVALEDHLQRLTPAPAPCRRTRGKRHGDESAPPGRGA